MYTLAWFKSHYKILLAGIVIWSLAVRVIGLSAPKDYVFDEVYHAVTAKLIARDDVRAYEWWNDPVEPNTAVDWLHPPLAKYSQAGFIKLFGETPFAWRLSAALFGTLVILLTAKLAYALTQDELISLMAALLASFDGLLLTQSRIAMNDIHVTAGIVGAAYCYIRFRALQSSDQLFPQPKARKWWWLAFFTAGLALASKWSGLFVVVWLGGWEFQRTALWLLQQKKHQINTLIKWLVAGFGTMVLLPALIYVASYSHMFLQGKSLVCFGDQLKQGVCYCDQTSSWWVTALKTVNPANSLKWEQLEARGGCKRLLSHFSELHKQIWWYQTNLTATHGYQSRPWQWFLNLKPVWFHVTYAPNGRVGNIYAQGNPSLFWIGDIAVVASVIWLFVMISRKKIPSEWTRLAQLVSLYFVVWLPWQFSPRIMFFYHYTPAVPFLSIILAWWLGKSLRLKPQPAWARGLVLSVILVCALAFVLWYPHWTDWPVEKTWAKTWYFSIPSWQ